MMIINSSEKSPLPKILYSNWRRTLSSQFVILSVLFYNIKHEDYNWIITFQNNTALVEFDRAIVGKYIEPIPITAKDRDPADNPDCWVTGWGMKGWY